MWKSFEVHPALTMPVKVLKPGKLKEVYRSPLTGNCCFQWKVVLVGSLHANKLRAERREWNQVPCISSKCSKVLRNKKCAFRCASTNTEVKDFELQIFDGTKSQADECVQAFNEGVDNGITNQDLEAARSYDHDYGRWVGMQMALRHGRTPVRMWRIQNLDNYSIKFTEFLPDAPESLFPPKSSDGSRRSRSRSRDKIR